MMHSWQKHLSVLNNAHYILVHWVSSQLTHTDSFYLLIRNIGAVLVSTLFSTTKRWNSSSRGAVPYLGTKKSNILVIAITLITGSYASQHCSISFCFQKVPYIQQLICPYQDSLYSFQTKRWWPRAALIVCQTTSLLFFLPKYMCSSPSSFTMFHAHPKNFINSMFIQGSTGYVFMYVRS